MAGKPAVCSGHGGPAKGGTPGLATAAAVARGDGKTMPVRGPATTGGLGEGEGDEVAGAGLVGGFDATAPGDVAGEDEAAAEGGGLETAPCATGLAPPAGEGLSCSAGARAPIFAMS